jgi:site-specific recombinase XerD
MFDTQEQWILLQQGIEQSVIALWLGHESIETTQVYLDADLEMKPRALDAVTPQRKAGSLSTRRQAPHLPQQ